MTIFFSTYDAAICDTSKPCASKSKSLTKVIFILAFLWILALLMPAISSPRGAEKSMRCRSNIKQILIALHHYKDTYGKFPPAYTVDTTGKPIHSWRVLILPYLNEQSLYDEIKLDEPWDSEYNKQFHDREVSVFTCPECNVTNELLIGTTSMLNLERQDTNQFRLDFSKQKYQCGYSFIVGTKIESNNNETCSSEVSHWPNPVILVERSLPINWMDPTQEILYSKAKNGVNRDIYGVGSGHKGGCNIGLADGSVLFMKNTNNQKEVERLEKVLQGVSEAD
ncbi:MAG: DUF1559 domain-containing protein [Thermoguttaceae bacterium]